MAGDRGAQVFLGEEGTELVDETAVLLAQWLQRPANRTLTVKTALEELRESLKVRLLDREN